MKRLFQIILALVILLLITIHQAIAGNTNHTELRNDKKVNHLRYKIQITPDKHKNLKKDIVRQQPDIVKEYITKRSFADNRC